MRTYYIYPTYDPTRNNSGNKYIKFFHEAVNEKSIVNNNNEKLGIFNCLFNLNSDVFVFQWMDLVPFNRLGIFQSLFFSINNPFIKAIWKKNSLDTS